MLHRIVALDPGGTTGWATITITEEGVYEFQHGMFEQLNHHEELFAELKAWSGSDCSYPSHTHPDITTVVCESFEYRNANRPGLELISVEYIGVMKLYCQMYEIPYHMQKAAQGKIRNKPGAFVKPDNLKRLGLYKPNQVHAMDAYGHLLYYLINEVPKTRLGYADIALELLQKGWKD